MNKSTTQMILILVVVGVIGYYAYNSGMISIPSGTSAGVGGQLIGGGAGTTINVDTLDPTVVASYGNTANAGLSSTVVGYRVIPSSTGQAVDYSTTGLASAKFQKGDTLTIQSLPNATNYSVKANPITMKSGVNNIYFAGANLGTASCRIVGDPAYAVTGGSNNLASNYDTIGGGYAVSGTLYCKGSSDKTVYGFNGIEFAWDYNAVAIDYVDIKDPSTGASLPAGSYMMSTTTDANGTVRKYFMYNGQLDFGVEKAFPIVIKMKSTGSYYADSGTLDSTFIRVRDVFDYLNGTTLAIERGVESNTGGDTNSGTDTTERWYLAIGN